MKRTIKIDSCDIHLESIMDLDLIDNKVILKYSSLYKSVAITFNNYIQFIRIKDPKEMHRIKFEYIKYIKTLKRPEDRVAGFEFRNHHRLPDFDKMDRLIESRKTRKEKEKERQEELYIMEQCKKYNLKYYGPLGRV